MRPRCYVVPFEVVTCHARVDAAPGRAGVFRGTPWMEDHLVLRPVFDPEGRAVERFAGSEEGVVREVVQFLEARFGAAPSAIAPCIEAEQHILVKAAPFRWTDKLH